MAGLELCLANLEIAKIIMVKSCQDKVKEWGEDTMGESKFTFCPIDTRRLMNSGNVTVLKDSEEEFTVKLAYNSDGSAPYAVYVHQIPIPHAHGQWQFLLTPFNKNQNKLFSKLSEVKIS